MTAKQAMPKAAIQAINGALGTTPVLWSGMPRPRAALLTWLPIWIIAVPWIGISVLAVFSAIGPSAPGAQSQMSRIGAVIAVSFVVGGVYMLLAPVFAARSARRTVYALGPDRLWEIDLRGKGPPVAHDIARVLSTERTERADGSGTLTLSIGSRAENGITLQTGQVTLRSVPDVRRLEQLIRASSASSSAPRHA